MKHTLAAVALCALAACSQQELYGRLDERQANEMVAALRSAGLEADKQPQGEDRFSVTTRPDQFARAVEVLKAGGHPRNHHDSLGQVFKKEGFVSSPLEERARLMHALSQEISSTLSSIDGVVMARVHLSVPEKDPLADKPRAAAASVFIKHRRETDLAPQLGHIKALVVNAIEGLPYDNVTVALFPADPLPPPPPARALDALGTPLMALASLGVVAVGTGGGLWWLSRRRRPAAEALAAVPRIVVAEPDRSAHAPASSPVAAAEGRRPLEEPR